MNLRPQARADVEDCFVYLHNENADAAIEFLAAFYNALDRLADQPFIGASREFRNRRTSGLRMWIIPGFENYQIYYLVFDNDVEVVRVLHSARDIKKILNTK